jgi:starch-binding outer membrane protein, SusD/RagB family
MKKNLIYTVIIGASALVLSLQSCKKQLNQTPKYGLNSEVVYSDPDNYINVLAKMYSGLSLTGIQGPAGNGDIAGIDEGFSAYIRVMFNLQDIPTDAAICGWGDAGIPEMNNMEWSAENPFVKAMYFRIYYQVTLCNEFIRESSDAKMTERGFSEADKSKIRTFREEARFLRALSYYHALDLFGNVPFVTEEDNVGAFIPERITRAELFTYVESELKDIETKLASPTATPYGRASQTAAQFLLAKLYLNAEVYSGTPRYADCASYANTVINSGAFALDDNYQHLFLADNHTSPEIIFPVTFDGINTQTYGGTTFLTFASIGGAMVASEYGVNGGWGGLRATQNHVDLFTDSMLDSRYLFYRTNHTKEVTSVGTFTSGYALPKYKNITSTGANGSNVNGFVDIDFPMFRLADAYLMYAEAVIRGGGNTSLAEQRFNAVRERAYGNSDFNITGVTLQDIIDERGKELQWECTRRTDLIRFGMFTGGSYLWPFKGGVVEGASVSSHLNLYPLPTSDIVLNPNLIQNPGY